MCAIFYGWGLGLFGHVPHHRLPLFVIAAWAMMLICSPLWQRRFALGPAEWPWRSLARGKTQKIRNSDWISIATYYHLRYLPFQEICLVVCVCNAKIGRASCRERVCQYV